MKIRPNLLILLCTNLLFSQQYEFDKLNLETGETIRRIESFALPEGKQLIGSESFGTWKYFHKQISEYEILKDEDGIPSEVLVSILLSLGTTEMASGEEYTKNQEASSATGHRFLFQGHPGNYKKSVLDPVDWPAYTGDIRSIKFLDRELIPATTINIGETLELDSLSILQHFGLQESLSGDGSCSIRLISVENTKQGSLAAFKLRIEMNVETLNEHGQNCKVKIGAFGTITHYRERNNIISQAQWSNGNINSNRLCIRNAYLYTFWAFFVVH